MSNTSQESKKDKVVTIGTLIIACAATGILSMVVSIYLSNLEKVSSETFIGTIVTLIGVIVALAIGFQIYNSLDSKRSIEKLMEQVEKKISNYDIEHNKLKSKISNIDILRNDLKYTMNFIQMNQCDMIIEIMLANEKGKIGYNQAILTALISGLKHRLASDKLQTLTSKEVRNDKIIYDYDYYTKGIILLIYIMVFDDDISELKQILEVIPNEIKKSNIKKHSSYANIRFSIELIENLLEKIEAYNYKKELIIKDNYIQKLFETINSSLSNE